MPRSFHSTLILVVVFVLGLAAGICGMVWAWPGVHNRYMRPRHLTPTQRLTKSLQLTPQQIPQVQSVFNDARTERHQIYLQFYPQYAQACSQFSQVLSDVSKQEHQAYEPIRQKNLGKLQSILTPQQWQEMQAQQRQQAGGRGGRSSHPHQDMCRRLIGPPPSQAPAGSHQPKP